MDENMLNAYLPVWLNVIFFLLFRHLLHKRGRVVAKHAPSGKLLPPQVGHIYLTG
jgi:hypothetical protein